MTLQYINFAFFIIFIDLLGTVKDLTTLKKTWEEKVFTIPNILSASRLISLPFLYYLAFNNNKIMLAISLILVAATDLIDGRLARKLKQTSELGRYLDSYADLSVFLSTIVFYYYFYPENVNPFFPYIIILLVMRVSFFIITVLRFHVPFVLHSFLNKLTGIAVYVAVMASFFIETSFLIPIIIAIAYASLVEEFAVLTFFGMVNPRTNSIFSAKIPEEKDINTEEQEKVS